MLDLNLLRDSGNFSIDGGPPRLALVHHGFRTTLKKQGHAKQAKFASRYASLGLLNLARLLQVDFERSHLPFAPEVRYFDEDCYEDDDDLASAVAAWIRPASARFILVGLYTLAVERTAGLLARMDPREVCIVVGGPHATVAPQIDYAHIVVRGEGGTPLRHILNELFKPTFGEGPEARGLCFELDGKLQMSGVAFDNSLAKIPPPAFAYDLSESRIDPGGRPRGRWWRTVGKSPQIYVCTQSCRARCTFCSTYIIHGRLVSRPVELIKGDLDYIVDDLGHDSIEFHDDDLLQHEDFDLLMELLAEKRITWTCNARAEFMTAARAQQMFAAGCRKTFLGIESLNQEILDYYRKQTTVEMNEAAVRVLDAAGIGVVCGFIIGAPDHTVGGILEELNHFLALPIYFLSASILTPDIGTVEYHRAKKIVPGLRLLGEEGSSVNMKPRPDLFGTDPPYGLPTVCKAVSKADLNELYELAYCEFFLRASTRARIERLTQLDRLDEVDEWYAWTRERARTLVKSARLDSVQERAVALMSNLEA